MKILIATTMFPKFLNDYYGSAVFHEAEGLKREGQSIHVVTHWYRTLQQESSLGGIRVNRFGWLAPSEPRLLGCDQRE